MKIKTNIKTEWDLTHFYKGDYKKGVAKDLAIIKKSYLSFAKKYRKDKSHLKNPKALAKAIEEYEKLISDISGERPFRYFSYRKYLNSKDDEATSELSRISNFFIPLTNEIEFFMLEIAKIPKEKQKIFLNHKDLSDFKYLLTKIFENAKYNLSEPEEKILNLKSRPSHGMWTSGVSKTLSKQMVGWQGKEITISEASGKIPKLETKERRSLHKELLKVFESVSDFSEHEINAIVTNKKINDELRGFKTPYESTVKGYENESKTVKDLVEVVTKNFHMAHSFYKIKAEMLGESKLQYADRSAQIKNSKVEIKIEEAAQKTIEAFNSAHTDFGNFVKEMFGGGLVDVFPKKGKGSGAFCSGGVRSLPVYVFLNHNNDFRSLTTLAHEMGHAIHFKFSKKQRPIYEDCTIATAEVASTFFENLVFEKALEGVSDEEKMILLHDKINDDISTIFRQIACFNFENELHETIRKVGFLPKEEVAKLMNKHMQSYLGTIFELTDLDGYFFVNWSHIRNFFYVYSYAFGQLISDALYERYKKDPKTIKDVIQFLEAGGSNSPENIFRKIGINPNKKFFENGLLRIKQNIDELEVLWKKYKK